MNYKEFRKTINKCPFCDLPKEEIVKENDSAIVLLARAPYIKDHLLVIPKNHVFKLPELNEKERKELFELVFWAQNNIETKYHTFSTFYREGENVGKSVSHAHFNIIPKLILGTIHENLSDRPVYRYEEYLEKTKEFN